MKAIAAMLVVALPLALADIVSKETMTTQPWAFHERSPGWGLLCCVVLVGLVVVCRVPSRLVPPAAGLLAAGVVGNGLSAAMHGFVVPNPLILEGETTTVAFNLADVWAVLGIGTLTTVLAVWLIRNRHLFPSHRRPGSLVPARVRARSGEEHDPVAEDGNTVF